MGQVALTPARIIVVGLALLSAAPALAQQQQRDYCTGRPGLGTDACVTPVGRLSVETGLASWQRDDMPDERETTVLLGDTELRFGVTDDVEIDLSWTPFGTVRTRDKASGAVTRMRGVGDVSLGFKWNFANPDGSGLSYGSAGFVSLPTGGQAIGAGDWGAGFLLPVTYDLSDSVNLQLTPEIDAAPDEDRHGRHLAYSAILGLGVALSDAVTATGELQALRDDDPAGGSTEAVAALALAWMPSDDLQFDIGGIAGLNDRTPDIQLYVGIARRF